MKQFILAFILLIGFLPLLVKANNTLGKNLYQSRCAMCHGDDGRGDGPLAKKSNPPATDFTSLVFQKRLADYPGVIVASLVLGPNQKLILGTLQKNHVVLPKHVWTDAELRAVNYYILSLIAKHNKQTQKPTTYQ